MVPPPGQSLTHLSDHNRAEPFGVIEQATEHRSINAESVTALASDHMIF
jgi:hypothetical protein